jgi:hypothetical protein
MELAFQVIDHEYNFSAASSVRLSRSDPFTAVFTGSTVYIVPALRA